MAKKLSGEEKAAILLMSLGEDSAANVVRHLEPKDIRRLGGPMSTLTNITPDLRRQVIQEFRTLSSGGELGGGGKSYMKNVLNKALGPEKASQIIADLAVPKYKGLEALKWLDAKSLSDLIAAEHPQTAAVILAHLEADQASQALRLLPDEARLDIAYRLATLNEIHPDVLKELSEVLESEVKHDVKAKGPQLGGVKFLAEIMNGLDRATEQTVTAGLAEKNPELADSVRQLMFVFEDLAILDDRGFQDLLKEVAKEDLMLALRATSEPVKAAVFRNMSSRAAEMLKDDLEAAPPVKMSEVEKAKRNIVQVARKLEEEGRIMLRGGQGGEEELV